MSFLTSFIRACLMILTLCAVTGCRLASNSAPAPMQTIAAGNENIWFLSNRIVSEAEFKRALSLARAGNIEAIQTVYLYYSHREMHGEEDYWNAKYEAAMARQDKAITKRQR